VDDPSYAALVFNQHGCVVFHGPLVNGIRELRHHPPWLSEKIVEYIDAMAGDVEQRSTTRELRIEQPRAEFALRRRRAMMICLGQHRTPDRALLDEFPGAL